MSEPKDFTRYAIVYGRLFPADEACDRLLKVVAGAVADAVRTHPDRTHEELNSSIAKRVTKQLVGNGYALELLASLARSNENGARVQLTELAGRDEVLEEAARIVLEMDPTSTALRILATRIRARKGPR